MTLPRSAHRSVSDWDFDSCSRRESRGGDDDYLSSARIFKECCDKNASHTPGFQDFEPFFSWMPRPQMPRRVQYELAQIERERFNQPGPRQHCFGPGSRSRFNFDEPAHPFRSDFERPRAPFQRDEDTPAEPLYTNLSYKAPYMNVPVRDLKIQPLLDVPGSPKTSGRNWEADWNGYDTKAPVVPVSYGPLPKPELNWPPKLELPVIPEGPDASDRPPITWRTDTLAAYEEAIHYKRPLVIMLSDDGQLSQQQYREMNEDREGRFRRMSPHAVWVVGKPRYDETAGHIQNYLSIKHFPAVSVLEPNGNIQPRVILEGYFNPHETADQLEYYLDPDYIPPPSPPKKDNAPETLIV